MEPGGQHRIESGNTAYGIAGAMLGPQATHAEKMELVKMLAGMQGNRDVMGPSSFAPDGPPPNAQGQEMGYQLGKPGQMLQLPDTLRAPTSGPMHGPQQRQPFGMPPAGLPGTVRKKPF